MTSIRKVQEILAGCFVIEPVVYTDKRGGFVKTIHNQIFEELGISLNVREEFFSISDKNVIRGMHAQMPPAQHNKLVSCIQGEMLDVVLDLRKGPDYGRVASVVLTEKNYYQLYVPKGVAHGFLALQSRSIMLYRTDVVHSIDCDKSIRWDSFGFNWRLDDPVVSERDAAAVKFHDFITPF